jgi:hypothetical protein
VTDPVADFLRTSRESVAGWWGLSPLPSDEADCGEGEFAGPDQPGFQ